MKRCPKPFSTIPLTCENTIYSVWLHIIGNPAFLNFVISQEAYSRSVPRPQLGGGKRERRPPKQKFRPSKPAYTPPKLPFFLRQFQDGDFCFLGTNRELAEK